MARKEHVDKPHEIRNALLRVRSAMRFRGELPRTRFSGAEPADLEAEATATVVAMESRSTVPSRTIWLRLERAGYIEGSPYRLTDKGVAELASTRRP